MDDLFQKRMAILGNTGDKVLQESNQIMDKTFLNDINCKRDKLYDQNLNYLDTVYYKFQRSTNYTINKDQVEYWIQFMSDFFPEEKYPTQLEQNASSSPNPNDVYEHLGFSIDVKGAGGKTSKWLILGKDDRNAFVRYNTLKCNWTFQWTDRNGSSHSFLGVLRSRNNYNSGVWSDGFTTTTENQSMFIVPSNVITQTIDYDTRFIISENRKFPKVYEVTKVEDTYPLGVIKVTLAQCHTNNNDDNAETGLAGSNYAVRDTETKTQTGKLVAKMNCEAKGIFYKGANTKILYSIYDETGNIKEVSPTWHYYIWMFDESKKLSKQEITVEDLSVYLSISPLENETGIMIQYPQDRKADLVGYKLTFEISDDVRKTYSASMDLEVSR